MRLATFNCESLFARSKFTKQIDPARVATTNGITINEVHFNLLKRAEKRLTAETIAAVDADIIALQEVEGVDVLKRFQIDRLASEKYVPLPRSRE